MVPFNDNKAWIQGTGNLTLGLGQDDGAGDGTHTYAKADVWIPISAVGITSDTQPALTRVGAGSYKRTLVASTTHNVVIPFDMAMLRTFTGAPSASVPHGVKVLSMAVSYRVNGASATSITPSIQTIPLSAAASLGTATALTSTTAGNTLTNAANVYLSVTTVTTPVFVNTQDTLLTGEFVVVTPMSCTVDMLGASWRVAVALY